MPRWGRRIIAQFVLLHDIGSTSHLMSEPPFITSREIRYADDTLLISSHVDNLQQVLGGIVEEGRRYGLELDWDKTLQMQVATAATIVQPCGAPIRCAREPVYIGGLISCDGKASRGLIEPTAGSRQSHFR